MNQGLLCSEAQCWVWGCTGVQKAIGFLPCVAYALVEQTGMNGMTTSPMRTGAWKGNGHGADELRRDLSLLWRLEKGL